MKKRNGLSQALLLLLAASVRSILALRYKVSINGLEQLDKNTPTLILPNHPALVDPMILLSHIYPHSNAIPVLSAAFYDLPVLKQFFKHVGAVRVSDLDGGSRNINVLKDITRAVLKGFNRNKNIILYPSGQLAAKGKEKIFNKKSAHKIINKAPQNVRILGVRTTGLWGSMWSKAKTGKSPHFFIQLMKGIFFILANLIFFLPRRKVTIEIEELSSRARDKAEVGRKELNLFLEEFYNYRGEEAQTVLSHFFFLPHKKGN
jgi:long-chain-fatty-acid--[acyl-carrier-protein] ligase